MPAAPSALPSRRARAAGPLQLALGTVGTIGAGVLLGPKLLALSASGTVGALPLAANLALLGGSLMFLREGWRAWQRARVRSPQASTTDRAAV